MEKRVILAIALSMLIILAFQFFLPKPPAAVNKVSQQTVQSGVVKTEAPAISEQKELPREEQELKIETEKYVLVFSNVGGALKAVYLKEFKTPTTNEPLKFIQIDNPRNYIGSINDSTGQNSLDINVYNVKREGDSVIYFLRVGDFEISKRFILHNYKYTIELELDIKNISAAPKGLNYRIIGGAGVNEANAQDKRFLEVVSKLDGKTLGFKRPKAEERIMHPGIVSWEALKNKYFSIILKPFVNTQYGFYGEDRNGSLIMGVEPQVNIIQPGSFTSDKFLLYIGPSQEHILNEIGYDLTETISYGFFGWISKALIAAMRFFYNIFHNWGIAIILLSVFLNIILFPLTAKSFKSIQEMQEIHPQMEKLKVQYKDNPQKLNKEIMELYKKYNINPFGGCLPMLLQMPIFIALYQALMRSIELRNAGFLWIKDLSLPDAVPMPISLPIFGNTINILPIIMIVAMVVQQKISTKSMGAAVTEEQKQQQKIMLIIMPVMFGFIFYNMPSGLVLYWVINTVLTLAEQGLLLRQA